MKVAFRVGRWLVEVGRYLGIGPDTTSHPEKFISAIGGALGMLVLYYGLRWYAHEQAVFLLLTSLAATAVLVFAVPHGALSQPWPVLGGYLISALAGVTWHRWMPALEWAIPLAVGTALLGMYYLRCLDPPGGAVALAAVIGGPEIQQLGYHFIWLPALANAAVLVVVGVIYNRFFPWRRYPVHVMHLKPHAHLQPDAQKSVTLTEADFAHALQQMNSFIDITPEDLLELYACAQDQALKRAQAIKQTRPRLRRVA